MEERRWGFFQGNKTRRIYKPSGKRTAHPLCNSVSGRAAPLAPPSSRRSAAAQKTAASRPPLPDPRSTSGSRAVGLSTGPTEYFHCLWKSVCLFRGHLNLFQIYQELLFYFSLPSLPFFLPFILPSYKKKKWYPQSPQLLRSFVNFVFFFFFTSQVNTFA